MGNDTGTCRYLSDYKTPVESRIVMYFDFMGAGQDPITEATLQASVDAANAQRTADAAKLALLQIPDTASPAERSALEIVARNTEEIAKQKKALELETVRMAFGLSDPQMEILKQSTSATSVNAPYTVQRVLEVIPPIDAYEKNSESIVVSPINKKLLIGGLVAAGLVTILLIRK
jgi:hypothetical protein